MSPHSFTFDIFSLVPTILLRNTPSLTTATGNMATAPNLVERLLDLPPELRTNIYEFINGPYPMGSLDSFWDGDRLRSMLEVMGTPPVLRINKTLRQDVLSLCSPYQHISLDSDMPGGVFVIRDWVASLNSGVALTVKKIEYRYFHCDNT